MHDSLSPRNFGLTAGEQAQAVAALRHMLQAQASPAAPDRAGVQLIETHISYVLLAGGFAYKIKKAVDLGFLDFRALRQREFYCREELRLNRRTAPELYLDVLPLTGTLSRPCIGGAGPAMDWVLRMRAFDQDGLWDRLATRGQLQPAHIDAGTEALCALHDAAAVAAPDHPAARPQQVRAPVHESLAALRQACLTPHECARLDTLSDWEARTFEQLHDTFERRARAGRVRECHGDLHLGNVTEFEGRTTLFDCLEFNAALRWTDVMSDVAFMAMDLHAHGLPRLAHRFVNCMVERSGDHDGLSVLRYYALYRALVRAKVAALRDAQSCSPAAPRFAAPHDMRHYLEVAHAGIRSTAPVLILAHGFSGSGKTTLTQGLLESCGAIRLRADVERKRLFGLAPWARSDAALKPQLYGDDATQATQARLRSLATVVLQSSYSVILDATFLAHAQRQQARALADRLGVRTVLLHFEARVDTLRERVRQRAQRGDDASEADLAVLEVQLAMAQPLQDDELAMTHVVDAEAPLDDQDASTRWRPLLRQLGLRED